MRATMSVANSLIQLAESQSLALIGSQLHGLLYLVHGWRLATLNKPLLHEAVLAGRDGVVIASLNEAGISGSRPVRSLLSQIVPSEDGGQLRERILILKPDDPVQALVVETWTRYRHLSSYDLGLTIREPGGPWDETWNHPERLSGGLETAASGARGDDHEAERAAIIPDALIRRWFRRQMIDAQKAQAMADGLERTLDVAGHSLEATISARVEPELRSR